MAQWIQAVPLQELKAGAPKILQTEEGRIALYKIEGQENGIYAILDVCTHDDGPLAEGLVEGCAIECPRHGAKFDLRTGAVVCMPAVTPIRTFPVRVNGQNIEVQVSG
jgi:3-phenylpropionate/trans-cinnamate dioxygenase ferredoxin subunit